MRVIKLLIINCLLIAIASPSTGQINSIGYPFIKNFDRTDHQAGLQSWMISQSPDGIMYFANNEGLLEFDGTSWKLYKVPESQIIRSVFVDTDGKIYVGGNGNFGFFETNQTGELIFQSLLPKLPSTKKGFDEIWKIHKTSQGIIFQSYKQLIVYNNDSLKVFETSTLFHFSFFVNNKLYLGDNFYGIVEFIDGNFIPLENCKMFATMEICAILPLDNKLLIATTNNGIYIYEQQKVKKWTGALNNFLEKNQIYCAIQFKNQYIAFGTIQKGLIICTTEGKKILSVDETKGLQNNTILSMTLDADENLWLATDNGIDLMFFSLQLSQLTKYQGLSAGYTAIMHNNILYLGTNRGLFYKKWNNGQAINTEAGNYNLIENTKGQVWKLQLIDNTLFCGHNNGTYIIKDSSAQKISDIRGVWIFLRSTQKNNKIIAGTYTGLILFEKINEQWLFSKKIEGFEESSRVMELDHDNSLWMSHGFKGVYHIKLNENFDSISKIDFYDSQKGFYSNFNINVSKYQNNIVFLTPDGIYNYSNNHDTMLVSNDITNFFGSTNIRHIYTDSMKNIWYFTGEDVAVKRIQEDGTYIDIDLPFKSLKNSFIGGFQLVYVIDESNVIFGHENGFIHYCPNLSKNYRKEFKTFIQKIEIADSIYFSGHQFLKQICKQNLNYSQNNLHFFYSAVSFNDSEALEFSYYLEGYEKSWSKWEAQADKEYTNLREGNYKFYVKSRNISRIESSPVSFEFRINPPWHRTSIAYFLYTFSFILLIGVTIIGIRKRVEYLKAREKQHQKQKYAERQRQLEKDAIFAEKEIIKLRNEKLHEEMRIKDQELANSTMHTIQKNDFLISLKEDLNKIVANSNDQEVVREAKKIIRKIDSDIDNEQSWKVFEKHFSNVHEQFLCRLKHNFPQLTPAELRLCACLRMNISSKEIASLMNISLRGVESGRYRLRKSLNLDREANLTEFILSI